MNSPMLGIKVGRWILYIIFFVIEFLLLEKARHSTNSTTYYGIMVGTWIVFGFIERWLRMKR